VSIVSAALKSWLVENSFAVSTLTDDESWKAATSKALDDGKLTPAKFGELQAVKSPSAKDVFGGARVKAAGERYSDSKSVALHVKSGKSVVGFNGQPVETISQRENAKAGALLKKSAQRSGIQCELSEHENALLEECYQDDWCGKIGSEYETNIPGSRVKTLLNDSGSGGQNIVPIWFDENLTTFPLLYGELVPRVNITDMPRGNTVDSGSVGNPTVTWNNAEGSALTPFTTTALVAALNTTIYPVAVAIEVGRDFLADATPDTVGSILTGNVGQRLMAELDKVVAVGDGTTQPQGIFGASGLTDIGVPTGGNGAPPQVDDYERLMFGIGKQYRNAPMRCAFIGNDTTYRRLRGVPVGGADARRVFGMDESSYQVLDSPFVIQNDIPNTKAAFGALSKYTLYRRMAQEIQWVTGGRTLALTNTVLLNVRGRYGGRILDANAFSFSDNWQS
jgi:HK97 family phage major capsid protein